MYLSVCHSASGAPFDTNHVKLSRIVILQLSFQRKLYTRDIITIRDVNTSCYTTIRLYIAYLGENNRSAYSELTSCSISSAVANFFKEKKNDNVQSAFYTARLYSEDVHPFPAEMIQKEKKKNLTIKKANSG